MSPAIKNVLSSEWQCNPASWQCPSIPMGFDASARLAAERIDTGPFTVLSMEPTAVEQGCINLRCERTSVCGLDEAPSIVP